MSRRIGKLCEGCRDNKRAPFRVMASAYLCESCVQTWLRTGQIPGPLMPEEAPGVPAEAVSKMLEIVEATEPEFEIPEDVRAAMVRAGALR